MRKAFVLLCILVVGVHSLMADSPTVPNTIEFAGLNLKLTDKARKKIQTEVNALTRHPKYFQIKVDRLQIYFPIIERIFREENLPEDFKYLVLQESALISDAVSSSNAVGFWQFKKAAATEVGLRVDRNVDERLNIVASTRGAAKYIKKNNRVFFDNWVHALLAYQQGPGGAQKLVKKKYQGSSSMPIDNQTHWYVIKFLAHKIAFEQVKSAEPKLYLSEFYQGQGKSLKQIAQMHRMDQDLVQKYNKWLKSGKVPGDKPYAVILPYQQKQQKPTMIASSGRSQTADVSAGKNATTADMHQYRTHPGRYPVIKTYRNRNKGLKVNGIKGVRLKQDMDLATLERTTEVSVKRLLYYNDVSSNKKPRKGELWYLKPKKSKAEAAYHIVEDGENLWSISQKYGIKLKQLRKKNRIPKSQTTVKNGRVLWMQETRPVDIPVAIIQNEPAASEKPDPRSKPTNEPVKSNVQSAPKDQAEIVKEPIIEEGASTEKKKHETLVDEPPYKPDNDIKSSKKVHEVQQGETLYGIAKMYQVSLEQLYLWNELKANEVISIGQTLIVAETDQPDESVKAVSDHQKARFEIHRVESGETLYQIARQYNATIQQLMELNQKADFSLDIGEELKVPSQP